MENKIRHLEMIQGIINRMAGNSFMLKGWAVTLVAGIFALASKDADKMYFLVAYIPILVFWGLDGFYLCQERLYRLLYDEVREKADTAIDFSMRASAGSHSGEWKYSWLGSAFSKTELWFYLPLALVCASIIIVTHL